jgi:uncharacterized membrane protein YGL010W
MHALFRRQLAVYADYHRDARNCATHTLGIPLLFLAVVQPLSLVRVPLTANLAVLLVIPAVLFWIALDAGIGVVMLGFLVPLLLIAGVIVAQASLVLVWGLAIALFVIGWALQIVGHAVFERRRPALIDNLFQMLIGPMFMVAKLLVALGLRRDLAAIIGASPAAALDARSST